MRGYIPLRLMSDPPPPSARKVMQIGEAVTVVVVSFAAARRSIDCAMPDMAAHAPVDTDPLATEPVEQPRSARRGRGRKAAATPEVVDQPVEQFAPGPAGTGVRCGGVLDTGRGAADRRAGSAAGIEAGIGEEVRSRDDGRQAVGEEGACEEVACEEGAGEEGSGREGPGEEGRAKQAPATIAPVAVAPETVGPETIAPVTDAPAPTNSTRRAPAKKAPAKKRAMRGQERSGEEVARQAGPGQVRSGQD